MEINTIISIDMKTDELWKKVVIKKHKFCMAVLQCHVLGFIEGDEQSKNNLIKELQKIFKNIKDITLTETENDIYYINVLEEFEYYNFKANYIQGLKKLQEQYHNNIQELLDFGIHHSYNEPAIPENFKNHYKHINKIIDLEIEEKQKMLEFIIKKIEEEF